MPAPRRRRPRCRNIGLPRYEAIGELQREYYNRDSELILSDDERQTLKTWAARPKSTQQLAARSRIVLACAIMLVLTLAACGGSGPGGGGGSITPGSYTLTLSAASGATTHSATLVLTSVKAQRF